MEGISELIQEIELRGITLSMLRLDDGGWQLLADCPPGSLDANLSDLITANREAILDHVFNSVPVGPTPIFPLFNRLTIGGGTNDFD